MFWSWSHRFTCVTPGFSAETSIDRRDFGLTWNQALETGGVLVGHNVRISLNIQAVLAQEPATAEVAE